MSIVGLILKELRHRWLNFGLSLAAVAAAVALFVGYLTAAGAAQRETTRITRDLGFNLRIIPRATNMTGFGCWGIRS